MTVMLLVLAVVAALISEPEFRARVIDALARAKWGIDATAEQIGMSFSRLSKQINGHDQLTSLCRMCVRLDGFVPAFIEEMAPAYGIVVVREAQLQAMVRSIDAIDKRMARMSIDDLPLPIRGEQAS